MADRRSVRAFDSGGGAGILGSWIVRILDSLANKAERYADEVQQEASSHIPQWMKDPWRNIKSHLPFLGDVSLNKICKKVGLGSIGNAGVEAQKAIKAAAADQLLGSIGPISTLLVAKAPHVLDQQPYLNCLLTAANALPGVDARSCKYSDPHMWRLCVEFHIQLARSDPLHPNPPMSPRIIDCRKSALDLH